MITLFKATPKEYIAQLPLASFNEKIVVVDSLTECKKAIAFLNNHSILGIDTETRPAFKKGVKHKVSLLQISTEKVCFLFRLNRINIPTELADLLTNKNILKIGLSLKDDLQALRSRIEFKPNGFIDLQDYVKLLGIQDMSLQKLYANVFGKKISKGQRLSNWDADVLTDSQKHYASLDAYACLQLYSELLRLKETGDYIFK